MFDLAGTHFERGVFELRLERRLPRPLQIVTGLGPIRGRMLALFFLLMASFLTFKHQPMRFLLDHGWVNDPSLAQGLQAALTYLIAGIGAVLYVMVFFFRQERLDLSFDRHDKALRFRHVPMGAKFPAREGLSDFGSIEAMEVFGPDREPKTPNGFIELRLKNHRPPYQKIRFRFLSSDQFKIYPTNLSKLTGHLPIGDWVDPDNEIISPNGG